MVFANFFSILRCNTIKCNTIQYITIQYTTIQYNTIQYNTIQYNTIQCDFIIKYSNINWLRCPINLWFSLTFSHYNTIQYNTIQYNTIQYNTIQYNTIVDWMADVCLKFRMTSETLFLSVKIIG